MRKILQLGALSLLLAATACDKKTEPEANQAEAAQPVTASAGNDVAVSVPTEGVAEALKAGSGATDATASLPVQGSGDEMKALQQGVNGSAGGKK